MIHADGLMAATIKRQSQRNRFKQIPKNRGRELSRDYRQTGRCGLTDKKCSKHENLNIACGNIPFML